MQPSLAEGGHKPWMSCQFAFCVSRTGAHCQGTCHEYLPPRLSWLSSETPDLRGWSEFSLPQDNPATVKLIFKYSLYLDNFWRFTTFRKSIWANSNSLVYCSVTQLRLPWSEEAQQLHGRCSHPSHLCQAERQVDPQQLEPGSVHPDWSGQPWTPVHQDGGLRGRWWGELRGNIRLDDFSGGFLFSFLT